MDENVEKTNAMNPLTWHQSKHTFNLVVYFLQTIVRHWIFKMTKIRRLWAQARVKARLFLGQILLFIAVLRDFMTTFNFY